MTYKGTEQSNSGNFHSQYYGLILNAAKDAGIPFLGMYVVVHSGLSTSAQASTAINYATGHTPWWKTFPGFFWQVDLERWPTDDVPAAAGVDLAHELEVRTGKKAILYASKGQYGPRQLGSYPRWNANYPNRTAEDFKTAYALAGGAHGPGWARYGLPELVPRIWQYSDSTIIGDQHNCDANAFKGTAGEFAKMIGAGAPEGGNTVQASFFGTPYPGFTLDTTDVFHAIRLSTGNYGWHVPNDGIISLQATVDLRGLEKGDLVRVRAEYLIPGQSSATTQLLTQEVVSIDPSTTGGEYLVSTPNTNITLTKETDVLIQVAVRSATGDVTRALSYGPLTRISVLLFNA